MDSPREVLAAWFAGPKAENGDEFAGIVRRILEDYHYWRRNYFPEDGVVVDSHVRRHQETFQEDFEDRLMELLGWLKSDFPFYSPRYAAHMLSEQTLPSLAGYFAGMLYNPNNVTSEVAPVTTRLELEAAGMIAQMLGYRTGFWAHLTSGGTAANIEALWIARSVKFLPFVVRDIARSLSLASPLTQASHSELLTLTPESSLSLLDETFQAAMTKLGPEHGLRQAIAEFRNSQSNVAVNGLAGAAAETRMRLAIFVPESIHYSLGKAADVLGLGRGNLVRIRVDSDFRLDVSDLAAKLDEAERSGISPLAVVTVAGTTEEGAVDPIHEVLDLRSEREASGAQSFWIHADAAYGGYLKTITLPYRLGLGEPKTRVRVGGTERDIDLRLPEGVCDSLERLGECDSIVVDPHKLGYVPYPAGAVCFKNALVKAVARQDAAYLEDPPKSPQEERDSEAIGVYILEGSKPGAAAASVWLSHKVIPLDHTGHGLLIQETVRNACELRELLERYHEWAGITSVRAEVLCAPDSNIVCYAFRPTDGAPLEALNRMNRAIYRNFTIIPGERERVYGQKFFVSRTSLSEDRYGLSSVRGFLKRLGVSEEEYRELGVFLLRSVLMSPWYSLAKRRDRFYLSELVAELFAEAVAAANSLAQPSGPRIASGAPERSN